MNARSVWILFLCLLFAFGQPVAIAARGALTTSPYTTVTGQALAWSAPWTFVEDDAMQTADLDLVFLTDGTATVAVSTGDIMPENARGLVIGFLGGDTNLLQVIDAGAGGATSYWFDQFPVDAENFGAFSTATALDATNSVLLMFLAPVTSFGGGLASAQAAITLDGQPLFPSVDGMALQAQLGGVPGAESNATTTATTTEFLPVGQWVHEASGVQVAWDGTWVPLGPDGDDTFRLSGRVSTTMLNITIAPREGATPQMWADDLVRGREDMWRSYDFLPMVVGEDDVVVVGRDPTGEGGIVQEVLFLDDGETVAIVGLAVLEGDPVDVAEAYRASVRIDGRVPMEAVDFDLLGSGDVSLYADAGMVDASHFVGPQTGIEVQWSDAWQLDPNVSPPVGTDAESRSDTVNIDRIDDESLWITVLVMPADGESIDRYVEVISSPEWVAQYGPDATVVHSGVSGERGVVLVKNEGITPARMVATELLLVDNGQTLLFVSVGSRLDQAGTDIPFVQETVTVNGEPVLGWYPVEDIQTWLGQ